MIIYFLNLSFIFKLILKQLYRKKKNKNFIHVIFAGSLGTSVFDMDVYLVGASGGVYALLAAHLANVLLVSANQFVAYSKLF